MISSQESTLSLLARARAGDEFAVDALVRRYLPRLRAWATGRLPRWARDVADTDDIVQDAMIKTVRQLKTFEPERETAFIAYLRQAVWNRIRDEIRKSRVRPIANNLDVEPVSQMPSPLDETVGRDTLRVYEMALERLQPIEREAVIARVELGYTYAMLAGALGKPSPEAARKTVQRALIRMAEQMRDVR